MINIKNIITLTKNFLKQDINFLNRNDNNRSILYMFIGFAIYTLLIFANFWNLFINPLKKIGQVQNTIDIIIFISSILIFILSIIKILQLHNQLNIDKFAKYKPYEIFISKSIIVYLYSLIIIIGISLPGFIKYGLVLEKNVVYYIYVFWTILLLPIIPVVGALVLYSIFEKYFIKNKKIIKFLGVGIIVIILIFQTLLNVSMLNNGEYDGEYILKMCNQIKKVMIYPLQILSNIFYNIENFTSIISLLWYIVINILVALVIAFFLGKFYLRNDKE